jgi:predicted dehydrogenase
MPKREIGIGIIGGGYMGKRHAAALAAVGPIFNTGLRPRLQMIATTTMAGATAHAEALGFTEATDDYRKLIENPKVDAVIVATPAADHFEMCMAAIAAGKPVFCEKPLGKCFSEANALAEAAEKAGVLTMVGYNYAKTPATQFVRQMLANGEIGDITYLRCEHTEDFSADPQAPWWWRSEGRHNGTLNELSCHIINAALALGGPVTSLVSDLQTVHTARPSPEGMKPVTNDDHVQFICRYASGALGHLYSSRIATGRKMGYIYEIFGTKGAIRFNQEDQNSVWIYRGSQDARTAGFTQVLIGPAHPDYVNFNLGPAHGTGFGDQIAIEARDFLMAIETGQQVWPTFRDGAEVMRIIDAAWLSHETRAWVDVG